MADSLTLWVEADVWWSVTGIIPTSLYEMSLWVPDTHRSWIVPWLFPWSSLGSIVLLNPRGGSCPQSHPSCPFWRLSRNDEHYNKTCLKDVVPVTDKQACALKQIDVPVYIYAIQWMSSRSWKILVYNSYEETEQNFAKLLWKDVPGFWPAALSLQLSGQGRELQQK